MESTNVVPKWNGTWELRAYAGKYECSTDGTCELVDQREVIGVDNPFYQAYYYGWPVHGELGLLTMYCNQGGEAECPDWVTFSLQGIGSGPRVAAKSSEATLPKDLRARQERKLDSSAVRDLLESVGDGDVLLRSSAAELPKTVKR